MGSINDYNWDYQEKPKKSRRPFIFRFGRQVLVAAAFFAVVAAFINADNIIGSAARYVMGEGLDMSSSWVDFDSSKVSTGGDEDVAVMADAAAPEAFLAPASGVVVRDITVSEDGVATEKGIIIRGEAGQDIKAAAPGEVLYLGESSDGMIVQIEHSGGYYSVYQGLSDITVKNSDSVAAGDIIGSSKSGEIIFSVFNKDGELNPLDLLFGDTTASANTAGE